MAITSVSGAGRGSNGARYLRHRVISVHWRPNWSQVFFAAAATAATASPTAERAAGSRSASPGATCGHWTAIGEYSSLRLLSAAAGFYPILGPPRWRAVGYLSATAIGDCVYPDPRTTCEERWKNGAFADWRLCRITDDWHGSENVQTDKPPSGSRLSPSPSLPSVCLSVCLSIRLSVYPFVRLIDLLGSDGGRLRKHVRLRALRCYLFLLELLCRSLASSESLRCAKPGFHVCDWLLLGQSAAVVFFAV